MYRLIKGKKGVSKTLKIIGILIIMVLIGIMFFAVYQNVIQMEIEAQAKYTSGDVGMLMDVASAAPENLVSNYHTEIGNDALPVIGSLLINHKENKICTARDSEDMMWNEILNSAATAWGIGAVAETQHEIRKRLSEHAKRVGAQKQFQLQAQMTEPQLRNLLSKQVKARSVSQAEADNFLKAAVNTRTGPAISGALADEAGRDTIKTLYSPKGSGSIIKDMLVSGDKTQKKLVNDLVDYPSSKWDDIFDKAIKKGVPNAEKLRWSPTYSTENTINKLRTPAGKEFSEALQSEVGKEVDDVFQQRGIHKNIIQDSGGKNLDNIGLTISKGSEVSQGLTGKGIGANGGDEYARILATNKNIRNSLYARSDDYIKVAAHTKEHEFLAKMSNTRGGSKKVDKLLIRARKGTLKPKHIQKAFGKKALTKAAANEGSLTDVLRFYGKDKKLCNQLIAKPTIKSKIPVVRRFVAGQRAGVARSNKQILFSQNRLGQKLFKDINGKQLVKDMSGKGIKGISARVGVLRMAGKGITKITRGIQKVRALPGKIGRAVAKPFAKLLWKTVGKKVVEKNIHKGTERIVMKFGTKYIGTKLATSIGKLAGEKVAAVAMEPTMCGPVPCGKIANGIMWGISFGLDYVFVIAPLIAFIEAGHRASDDQLDKVSCYKYISGDELYAGPPDCKPEVKHLSISEGSFSWAKVYPLSVCESDKPQDYGGTKHIGDKCEYCPNAFISAPGDRIGRAGSHAVFTGPRVGCGLLSAAYTPAGYTCLIGLYGGWMYWYSKQPEGILNTLTGANILPRDKYYYMEFPDTVEISREYNHTTGETQMSMMSI